MIEWDCSSGDYSSGANLISSFAVTVDKGVPLEALKAAELAEYRSLMGHHTWDHPGHTASVSFSIPEGYEVRDNIIYKSED